MKKVNMSLLLVLCLIFYIFPTKAFASDISSETAKNSYYKKYSAIGDSICAGFTQADYDYKNGFDMKKNITNSPDFCYAKQVGKKLGSTVYNLGKPGCDTGELLDILTDDKNGLNSVYSNYIKESDLITLEIGSNDLLMATMHAVLNCIGGDIANMSTQEIMALADPLLTGDIAGMIHTMEVVKGIKLSQEQIKAIQGVLADESLSAIMEKAYESYCVNYPKVVEKIRAINSTAKLVILNYYNPYKSMNFKLSDITLDIGKIIQVPTDKMNKFAKNFCQQKGYVYVDISDIQTNVVDPHPSTVGHAQIAHNIIAALLNTITATAQTGGTITPAGENIVKTGEALTFTIAAVCGFQINDVLVDGKSVGPVNTYTFKDVKGNHCITASFQRVEGTARYNTYSAMGDSITAGYSLPDYKGDFSNPDSGYVALAAKQLGVTQNYNLALSAYRTEDLLNVLTNPSNKYYTCFRNDLQGSDLISVDIGSNDLTMTMLDMVLECLGKDTANMSAEERYEMIQTLLSGIQLNALPQNPEDYLGQNITEEQKIAIFNVLKTENIDARFAKAYEKFTKNWDSIISTIHNIKPTATLAAIGYYNSSPNLNFEYKGTTYYIGKVFQKYIDMMNAYISGKCDTAKAYIYVDTTGIDLNCFDPHPSKAGHAEIAERLVNAILNNAHKRVTSVSLNKTEDALTVGDADTLIATINPSDACNKHVTWSSSNASVASVDSTGKVTAVSAGTADITVTTVDGKKTATCKVTVNNPVIHAISVSLNKAEDTIVVGNTDTLIATVSPADATNKNVTWSSSNASVASVDSTGKVTAVSVGTADITVTTVDGNKTAVCKVTVINPVVHVISVSLNKTEDTIIVGGTDTLIATINPADASNKNVTWSSSNASVASVDSTGKVTAISVGTAVITVTTVDGNKTASCSVTVIKDKTSILPQTGSAVDTGTLILSGLITLLAGIVIIRLKKKES